MSRATASMQNKPSPPSRHRAEGKRAWPRICRDCSLAQLDPTACLQAVLCECSSGTDCAGPVLHVPYSLCHFTLQLMCLYTHFTQEETVPGGE